MACRSDYFSHHVLHIVDIVWIAFLVRQIYGILTRIIVGNRTAVTSQGNEILLYCFGKVVYNYPELLVFRFSVTSFLLGSISFYQPVIFFCIHLWQQGLVYIEEYPYFSVVYSFVLFFVFTVQFHIVIP